MTVRDHTHPPKPIRRRTAEYEYSRGCRVQHVGQRTVGNDLIKSYQDNSILGQFGPLDHSPPIVYKQFIKVCRINSMGTFLCDLEAFLFQLAKASFV
jgi:hypothetical protein